MILIICNLNLNSVITLYIMVCKKVYLSSSQFLKSPQICSNSLHSNAFMLMFPQRGIPLSWCRHDFLLFSLAQEPCTGHVQSNPRWWNVMAGNFIAGSCGCQCNAWRNFIVSYKRDRCLKSLLVRCKNWHLRLWQCETESSRCSQTTSH